MAGLGGDGGGGGGSSGAIRAGRAFIEVFMNDNAFWKSWRSLQQKMQRVGKVMIGVGAAAGGLGAAALKPVVATFVDFDDAIRAAGARAEATADQLQRMRDTALELGRTSGFGAGEVAKLMGELGTAGFKPDQINVMTGAVLNMARATGTDATQAAEVLGVALNGFQLRAEDATRVTDAMTKAANASAVNMKDLGESFKFAGPIAADFGVSLEDTLAVLGGLAQMGIRGEMAGTMFRRLGQSIATGEQKLNQLGVTGRTAAGDFRPMVDVLEDVRNALAGLGRADQAVALEDVFGLQGLTGASAIGKGAKSIRQLADEIHNSQGEARRTADAMDAGLGGSMRRLRGSVESLVIGFGDALAPTLATVSDFVTLLATGTRQWAAENQNVVATIAGVTVGVIAAGGALVGLGVAFTLAGTAMSAVLLPAKLLLGTIGLLMSPAVGVLALGAAFATQTEKGRAFFAGIVESLGPLKAGFRELNETFQQSWEGITAAIAKGDLGLAFSIGAAGLKLEWQKVVLFWTEKWVGFKEGFLRDFHEMAKKIENSAPWKLAKAIGDKTAEVFEGSVLKPWEAAGKIKTAGDLDDAIKDGVGLFGAMLGMPVDPAAGTPDFARAVLDMADAVRAAVPPPRTSMYAGVLAPFFGNDVGNMLALAMTDGINEKFKTDPDGSIARAQADLEAAKADLAALRAVALAPRDGPGAAGNFGGGGDFGAAMAELAAARPVLDAASVKGAFMVADASQMFGYSDNIPQQQLDTLKVVKEAVLGEKGKLAANIGAAVLNGMRAK